MKLLANAKNGVCSFVVIFLFLLSTGILSAEPWRFGVMPDTQWKPTEFHNGVSIHIIDAVVAEMIERKVDLVIHVGDVVQKNYPEAYETALAHFKPLAEAGIKFYPIRGNHDGDKAENAINFVNAFPDLPGRPGREGSSPDLPGMAGLTYAFVHKNTKFIMLDTFPVLVEGSGSVAYKPGDFQPWIDEQLQSEDHKHAFVVGHKNLIGQNHKDNLFSSRLVNRYPEMQNAFFRSLQKNGVRYYLSGHDHLYYRSRIKSPDRQYEVTQIICGSCSNKLYAPKEPFSLRDIPQAQELNRNSFVIFTVDDDRITGEYYSTKPFGQEPARPKWKLQDRFGYTLDGKIFEEQDAALKDFMRYELVP